MNMEHKFITIFGIVVCVLSSLAPSASSAQSKPPRNVGNKGNKIPKYLIVNKTGGRKSLIELNDEPKGNYKHY